MTSLHVDTLQSAYQLLDHALIYHQGHPVGTVAARDPELVAPNYEECFVRDFTASAFAFMLQGKNEVVGSFLASVLELRGQQRVAAGHDPAVGLMPASFKVAHNGRGEAKVVGDFGERAIGRVAPVDSALWWMILLRSYVITTGDVALAHRPEVQEGIRLTLKLYLQETFETSPAMLVPDASFMIDRRMGVDGHPLEIQALFYGMLRAAQELLLPEPANQQLLQTVNWRMQTLRSYVRIYYWLDRERLNEIHRFKGEEFGLEAVNVLNIFPESIPHWVDEWLPREAGYLVGNLGPSRMDFRFFALGNLLAILFGLTTEEQAEKIMRMYETRWDDLMGDMPAKIVYPAATGSKWEEITGSDPKNVPWSYHNGGNWPALLWAFTGAAIRAGRTDLAERAIDLATARLKDDRWPEYYDGRRGSLIGRRANFYQVWSASSYAVACAFLENPDSLPLFESLYF